METKIKKRNTTKKKVAIPTHKFYSAFLRNGLIKMGQGTTITLMDNFIMKWLPRESQPTKMTVENCFITMVVCTIRLETTNDIRCCL